MTANAADPRMPRILVVDDMPDNLFLMQGLFEDRYEVVQADSGQHALAILMGSDPPDMVLLDVMMPDMDGYEVLRRIRQHPPIANIPVIFLTALASQCDERLGLELGAIDYLTKPVDPELVMKCVSGHVRATAHARLLEALSEKLARHLVPESWTRLFQGPDAATIRFEHRQQTLLYAEAAGGAALDGRARDSLAAELEWLAARYNGRIDRYEDAAGVVFFDDPGACVRMAMDLQRSAAHLQLRMGVHTGICDIGTFRSDFEVRCTLIGHETRLAAKVAATAAIGSIAVSPETYALVRDELQTDPAGGLVTEEFNDSDLAQVSLTPAVPSSFAGLGRS
jgi:adenylate cyclase